MLSRKQVRAILQRFFCMIEHCERRWERSGNNEKVNLQKIIACFGDQSGVSTRTRMQSNMMPTGSASSAAPGLGNVLSR